MQDLVVEVDASDPRLRDDLDSLLNDLHLVRLDRDAITTDLRLCAVVDDEVPPVPAAASLRFEVDGFRLWQDGPDQYLTDRCSVLHVACDKRQGHAVVNSSFFNRPVREQRNFWSFGLLKLLRHSGLFSLHAAGLVDEAGRGLLIAGQSGSGKTTLTLGLVRAGWRYLSDDALLLRTGESGVGAIALRKHLFVDKSDMGRYTEFESEAQSPDRHGHPRCQVRFPDRLRQQFQSSCLPRTVVLTTLARNRHSRLAPISRASLITALLDGGGWQLFDRQTMTAQMNLLNRLGGQVRGYRLEAGRDLHADPAALAQLLADAA